MSNRNYLLAFTSKTGTIHILYIEKNNLGYRVEPVNGIPQDLYWPGGVGTFKVYAKQMEWEALPLDLLQQAKYNPVLQKINVMEKRFKQRQEGKHVKDHPR